MDTENSQPNFQSIRVQDLNQDDRPREKALRHGIQSLSDAELIAIVLNGGMPGCSVLDMARALLRDNGGSLTSVRKLTIPELIKRNKGIGQAKAVTLAAAFELGSRLRSEETAPVHSIRSSQEIYDFMRNDLEFKSHEEFWVIMVSRSNEIKQKICLSKGGTSSSVVDVKLLVKQALEALADGIILVHNHPSGATNPSPEDARLTKKIQEAAQLLDIRVLDHIIIGRGHYYSFADQGRL